MTNILPALGCVLLTVPAPCGPEVQYYLPQARQIPPAHMAMVSSFSLWNGPNGGTFTPSMRVELPATERSDPAVLSHELGHVVMATLGLQDAYQERFWADGRAVGLTTPYGRTDALEDAAESYSAIVHGRPWLVSPERVTWLRARVFGGQAAPALAGTKQAERSN